MIPGVGSEFVPATEKSVGSQVEASLGMDSEPRPQAETLRSLDLGDGGPAFTLKEIAKEGVCPWLPVHLSASINNRE